MKTILLKFSGPMQSWGTSSNYNTRYTDQYPSKSGIIGLVAASLGLDRENKNINKLNKLKFAVRIDQPGIIRKDFQIATNYEFDMESNKGKYLIDRYYIEDAIFIVAIGGNDNYIDKIYEAIKSPVYQPYMGRKSCPLPADFIINVVETTPLNALKSLDWKASDYYKKMNDKYIANIFYDSEKIENFYNIRNDKIIALSTKGRVYNPRFESKDFVNFDTTNNKQLDFFDNLEE